MKKSKNKSLRNFLFAGTALVAFATQASATTPVSPITSNYTGTIAITDDEDFSIRTDNSKTDSITITGSITTDAGGDGTLFLNNQNSSPIADPLTNTIIINGNIGAPGAALKLISIDGGEGAEDTPVDDVFNFIVNINGTTNAETITIYGQDTQVNFAGDVNGGLELASGDVGAAPMVTLADGFKITGTVTNNNANNGLLKFLGDNEVTGEIGLGNALHTMEIAGISGKVVTLDDDVTLKNILFSGDATLDIKGALDASGQITTETDGKGTLTLEDDADIAGAVGADGFALKAINISGDDTTLVEFENDVFAKNINFTNDGVMKTGGDVTSNINTAANNEGTLLIFASSTFDGNIGADGKALKEIDINGDNGRLTVTFTGTVDAAKIILSNAPNDPANATLNTVTFEKSVTGDIYFGSGDGAEGTLNFADGANLTGDIYAYTPGSILDYNGDSVSAKVFFLGSSTVSGSVGLGDFGGDVLDNINFNGDSAASVTINGDAIASSMSITAGTAVFKGNVAGDVADGDDEFSTTTVVGLDSATAKLVLDGGTLYGDVNFFFNDATVEIDNGGSIIGDLISGNGSNAAKGKLTFLGAGTLEGNTGGSSGNITSALSVLNFQNATGTAEITGFVNAETINVTGAGNAQIDGDTFASDILVDAGTITFGGDVEDFGSTNTDLTFTGDGAVKLDGGKLKGNVSVTDDLEGTLTLIDGASVTSNIGADDHAVKELRFEGTAKGLTLNGDIYAGDIVIGDIENTVIFNGIVTATSKTHLISIGDAEAQFSSAGNTVTGDVNFTDDGQISLLGSKLDGSITTDTTGTGNLYINGNPGFGDPFPEVTGNIGTSSKKLSSISLEAADSNILLDGDVYADGITITGSLSGRYVIFGGDVTGPIVLDNGFSAAQFGGDLTGAVTSTLGNAGVLEFLGNTTVKGQIGTASKTLENIYIDAGVGETATFENDIYLSNKISITDGGTAVFKGDIVGDIYFTSTGGTASIASGKSVDGQIYSDIAGTGNVTFLGDADVTGNLGTGSAFSMLNFAGTGKTISVGQAMNAANTTKIGTNKLEVGDTFSAGTGQELDFTIAGLTDYGRIISTGKAYVDEDTTVKVSITTSNYIANNTKFTLIDGATGGAVDELNTLNITGNSSLLSFEQDSSTDDLILVAKVKSFTTITGLDNQGQSTAGALDNLLVSLGSDPLDSGLNDALSALQNASTPEEAQEILNRLMPGADNATQNAIGAATSEVRAFEEKRIASIRTGEDETGMAAGVSGHGQALWLQGFGQTAQQGTREGVKGYTSGAYGTAIGYDTSNLFDGTLGFSLSFGNTNVNGRNANRTGTDINTYALGIYSNIPLKDHAFVNGQFGFARSDIDNARHDVTGPGVTAQASYNSTQATAKATLGKDYTTPSFTLITPSVSAAYTYLYTGSYNETGAGMANLNVNSDTSQALELGADLNTSWRMRSQNGDILRPALRLGYSYDLIGDRVETTAAFAGGGGAFTTAGAKPARGKFSAGTGFTYLSTAHWSFAANYNVDLKEKYLSHSGTMRLSLPF